MSELNSKIANATKWSAITEVIAKLIMPITGMIMARLLTPEAFGVVATFSVIITFSEIFSDAGFQKYLIQHEFASDEDRKICTNVAFWSNLSLSFLIWGVIAIFNEPLADLVGSPGLGIVLIVACAGIPLTGFCSIQMSLFKRDFDFKTLFLLRLVSILIPLFVTIPLAVWLRSYWALVLGTLAGNLANAFLISIKSKWKPSLHYSFSKLKEMFSFCIWSLVDSILVWATSYADIFFIANALNAYYLGLYKTSIAVVGQIVSIITATVFPVILPSLSRLQNDIPEMRNTLLKFQKMTGIILLPLGVGIFMFSDLITEIMLGGQWTEAAGFLGLWGLMEAVTFIFARFCSPVYPAIGKPRLSAIVQATHLVVLIPAIIISGHYGFKVLYVTRSLIRLELVLVNLIAVYAVIRQSPLKMFVNIFPETVCCVIMALVAMVLLHVSDGLILSCVWVAVCIVVYFVSLYLLFPKERATLATLFQTALKTVRRK